MIEYYKELPEKAEQLVLMVENANEYNVALNNEILDIKSLYKTSNEKPIAVFVESQTINIIVNGEYFKINNDYIVMNIIDIIKNIKFKHLIITNIRFINERLINTLLKAVNLEIIEFKNMLITRAMIGRLRFLNSLRVVIGQDIEEMAYKELLDRNIETLTISKTNFNSDLFNHMNLTKSSAKFMESIIINKKYDDLELVDFGTFLNLNSKLRYVYLKTNLDLYFIKDLIAVIQKSEHHSLNLIIDHSDEIMPLLPLIKQLDAVMGRNNRILINVYSTPITLSEYDLLTESVNSINIAGVEQFTKLEKIMVVYEHIIKLALENKIKSLAFKKKLLGYQIDSSILTDNLIMLNVDDTNYHYQGLLISDISSSQLSLNHTFITSNQLSKDLPVVKFLNQETHNDMIYYLNKCNYDEVLSINNHFNEVFSKDYDFKFINYSDIDHNILKHILIQIYVQNRTNQFNDKTFYNCFVSLRNKQKKHKHEIVEELKKIITNKEKSQ